MTDEGRRERLEVVHLTSEYWPYAQTGGLAEAVRGLARHQALNGQDVVVVLPLYGRVRDGPAELEPASPETTLPGRSDAPVRLWRAVGDRVEEGPEVLFVEHAPSFDRPGLYGDGTADYPDNARRFALFSRAALELLAAREAASPPAEAGAGGGDPPRILHVHDWHAAPALLYLAAETDSRAADAARPARPPQATVLTVHNAGFQGSFPLEALEELGLPPGRDLRGTLEWQGRLNFLKAGLVLADATTTVSPTHADELRTEEGGFGLDPMFRELGDRMVGILNGIDTTLWSPTSDPYFPRDYRYDARDLSGKRKARDRLRQAAGLEADPDVPLCGLAARLARQKGIDLLLSGRSFRDAPAQFICLGSGDRSYEERLSALAREGRVLVDTRFSERKEHELMAAADILLMPSLYEPCGLTQMRAQRYGTLPIGRRVGGLADTIVDGETGFLFDAFSPEALDAAIDRALGRFGDRVGWAEMMDRAMGRDFGWSGPAARYREVYRGALERIAGGSSLP